MRGDEGYLLALAYSTQRGYGRNHPFAAESAAAISMWKLCRKSWVLR
jgi:alpha-D-ribose 1-methylphosphonate 5-triphosphate synthase subunit PhnI